MARIAIIGAGISGMGAAYLLGREHEITLYEKEARAGGHSRTVTVDYDGRSIPVDTGFIVFNHLNYPHLSGLFAHLDVPVHKSDMSFAATIRGGWLEWGARDINAIFGQRRNLLRVRFAQLVRDVLRFNSLAEKAVAENPEITLGALIAHMGLGEWFRRYYLLPMAGAIWSCPTGQMMDFPARTLVRFFANHHLMSISGQPQWYTVTGGSQEYVRRLTASFADRVRTGCAAVSVRREHGAAVVRDSGGHAQAYDHVVLACHGDQALALLGDADDRERAVLSAFRYQKNIAVLHRDARVMPRRRRCWASWVYSSDGAPEHPEITVHYWMNQLQGIDPACPLFVSLNPAVDIPDALVFDRCSFDHPVFDTAAIAAQPQVRAMQGLRNIWYCGAHLGHGFHEDGLASAVDVARRLGCTTPWPVQGPDRREVPQWGRAA
jgi:predicted NAD/FAD-binding protein